MLTESQAAWLKANAKRGTQLARHVSLASLVDPGLLRAARIYLGLPVAVELELRCSPIVSSGGPAGLVLADQVLPELRRGLDPAGRQLAWSLTRARHGSISPALELEELLTWQSLEPTERSLQDAETKLKQAVVTIVREQKPQLAAWAARALPRLPESVRELSSARLLASAVEANGYRNAPSVAPSGAPPAWMVPPGRSQSEPGLQGSAALNGSTLEINRPPKSGHATIPLPADGRIWVGWWREGKQTWLQTTVPKSRPLSVEVDGAEIWIEAPGLGRVVLRDETAARVELVDYGSEASENRQRFAEWLRGRLPGLGLNVLPRGTTPTFPGPAADYLLVVYETGRFSEFISNFLPPEKWGCRPLIVLNVEEPPAFPNSISYSSMPAPEFYDEGPPTPVAGADDQLFRLALTTMHCTDPATWDGAVQQISDLIKSPPPPLAVLNGVPALPSVFLRRMPVFNELRLLLMVGEVGVVNLIGDRGNGRTMAAVDLLNDCSMRRRYSAGIWWPQDDNSYPDYLQHPSLIVFDEPRTSDYDSIRDNVATMMENGSCYLILTATPFTARDFQVPALDGGRWTQDERRELFRQASARAEQFGLGGVGRNDPLSSLVLNLPVRSVANLGVLFGTAVRSGKLNAGIRELTFPMPGLEEVLFNLDLVRPFAACPPDWAMLSPGSDIWSRYFGDSDGKPVELAHTLITDLFPSREIPLEVSEPLAEFARPIHQQIVDSYSKECGGDWAICPNDGYFLEYFAYHLWNAEPNRLSELTENIDWLLRVSREAPDWHYSLPASIKEDGALWLDLSPSLESFAGIYIERAK